MTAANGMPASAVQTESGQVTVTARSGSPHTAEALLAIVTGSTRCAAA